MGHDWLFEVLADMRTYAIRHGFVDLATKLDETEETARREIDSSGNDGSGSADSPVRTR
ncbi:MAG: hypothetical protein ACXIU8_13900 [Alkalilacustris sp.]